MRSNIEDEREGIPRHVREGLLRNDTEGVMRKVPGQAIMGNKLGEQGSPKHMPYGPLEGVPGPDGKSYYKP